MNALLRILPICAVLAVGPAFAAEPDHTSAHMAASNAAQAPNCPMAGAKGPMGNGRMMNGEMQGGQGMHGMKGGMSMPGSNGMRGGVPGAPGAGGMSCMRGSGGRAPSAGGPHAQHHRG